MRDVIEKGSTSDFHKQEFEQTVALDAEYFLLAVVYYFNYFKFFTSIYLLLLCFGICVRKPIAQKNLQ